MYRIAEESIVRRAETAEGAPPAAVELACPFCARVSTFATRGWASPGAAEGESAEVEGTSSNREGPVGLTRAECPACGRKPLFVWVPEGSQHALFVHPRPAAMRRPLQDVERVEELEGALLRAYRAAIDAYNGGQWLAATVLGGRAIEAMTRALVPESEREDTLAAQLVELLEHRDLEQPVLILAEALRRSRGLMEHFQGTLEPDPEAARDTLDLLDALLAYVFVLPDRVRRLRDRLAGEEGD